LGSCRFADDGGSSYLVVRGMAAPQTRASWHHFPDFCGPGFSCWLGIPGSHLCMGSYLDAVVRCDLRGNDHDACRSGSRNSHKKQQVLTTRLVEKSRTRGLTFRESRLSFPVRDSANKIQTFHSVSK